MTNTPDTPLNKHLDCLQDPRRHNIRHGLKEKHGHPSGCTLGELSDAPAAAPGVIWRLGRLLL